LLLILRANSSPNFIPNISNLISLSAEGEEQFREFILDVLKNKPSFVLDKNISVLKKAVTKEKLLAKIRASSKKLDALSTTKELYDLIGQLFLLYKTIGT